jgi:MFS transporter, DHA1 family, tetracycline resistance protein
MSGTPEKQRSPLLIIFLTIFIDMVGFGIVIPVLPLYAEGTRFNATPMQIGFLVGIYSCLQLICSPLFGKLSDRVGRKPVLLCSVIGTAAGFMIMGAAGSIWMLFLARIIDGASGGNISTAQACIADVTTPENRSKSMGLIGAAFGLGFVFGPAIGGVLSKVSLSAPFYFAGALALVNAAFIAFRLPETHGPEHRIQAHERASISDVFHQGNAALIITIFASYFLSIAAFSMMTTLFALFNLKRFGFDARHTGFILAYVGILGALIQGGLLRRLLKKPIEKQLTAIGCVLLAISMFLLPLCHSLSALLLVCAGVALGNGFITPTLNGLASRSADRRVQGRTLGLMQSAGSLGRTLGPPFATWLLGFDLASGNPGHYALTPFWVSGVILVLTLFLVLTLNPVKTPAPEPAAVPEM